MVNPVIFRPCADQDVSADTCRWYDVVGVMPSAEALLLRQVVRGLRATLQSE